MRILHISGRYVGTGGAETYLKALADAQRSAGHQVDFLFASAVPPMPPREQPVYFVPPSYGVRSGLRHWRAFMDRVRSLRPDIVHCHVVHYNVSPLILGEMAKTCATVYSVHDTLAFCLKEPAEDPQHPLARVLPSGEPCVDPVGRACWRNGCHREVLASRGLGGSIGRGIEVFWRLHALRRLGRFIVNSRFTREELVRNGFPPDRITVVAPGLCVSEAWKQESSRSAAAESTILYVGHLAPVKGVYVLLDALDKIRHLAWKAKLVGEGPARSGLEVRISSLGLAGRVLLEHGVEREHLPAIYRNADLLVFPSLAPESWGLVGAEAMYCGLPVVGFDVGATREWLAHRENGLLVQAGNVDRLAAALAELIQDAALRRRLGREAARHALQFVGDQAAFTLCIEAVYRQAMADRAKP